MPKPHTIETLTKDLNTLKTSVNKRLDAMVPQVQEMHDFIIDFRGFERGKASYTKEFNKDGSIRINKDVWALIVKLVMIIAGMVTLIGGIKVLTK